MRTFVGTLSATLIGFAALFSAAHAGAVGVVGQKAAPPRPVLVVIVVDQLAAWMADERWPALPPDGGFARLRREGLYVREMRFGHAATDTAPGHSALFTGAVPHESGILANEVVPEGGGEPVSFLFDPETRVVAPPGTNPGSKAGSSLAALRVETLADVLMAAHPDAEVVSLSLKDRGALFGAGRHPSAAIWLDPALGTFVTSTAFTREFPAWAASLGDAAALRAAMSSPWEASDRAWVSAHAATADDGNGEAAYQGLGTSFPHHIGSAKALRATPAGDALLFTLADAAATRLGTSGRPGLLSISLSANDYVVHLFGPHSWEAWDELAKLDRSLGALLGHLDQVFGENGYAVMLTGDHGSNALPELSMAAPSPWCGGSDGGRPDHWQRSCGPRRRLLQAEVVPALEAELGRVLGADRGPFVLGIADPMLFLTPKARALPPATRKILVRVTTTFLQERFGLSHVVDLRSAPPRCPTLANQSWNALVCRSVRAEGPGDLYLVVPPGTFFDPRLVPGAGVNHGSPYLYDRAVPLLVRTPSRARASEIRSQPLPFTAFVRTAAALLGVRAPAAAGAGEVLADH